jgi:hypothetical protein
VAEAGCPTLLDLFLRGISRVASVRRRSCSHQPETPDAVSSADLAFDQPLISCLSRNLALTWAEIRAPKRRCSRQRHFEGRRHYESGTRNVAIVAHLPGLSIEADDVPFLYSNSALQKLTFEQYAGLTLGAHDREREYAEVKPVFYVSEIETDLDKAPLGYKRCDIWLRRRHFHL